MKQMPLPAFEPQIDLSSRRIGLELEFTGIELDRAAGLVTECFGGTVTEDHRYQYWVSETSLGDFRVELDAQLLKKMAEENFFEKQLGIKLDPQNRESIESLVDRAAKVVVPLEIVMPPVTADRIDELERLRSAMQREGAKGTGGSLVHAFGMHLNVEQPDESSETVLRYLRAFLLLYPWLANRLKIDITRQLSPFIDPFPTEYIEKVLNDAYQPDESQLLEDYLKYNPTRNRPLDLTPILALQDLDRVRDALGKEKIKPRPTFHYRLPNSRVEDPEWTFGGELQNWMVVEALAGEAETVRRLSRLYRMRKKAKIMAFKKEWSATIAILLGLDEI